MMGKQLSVRTLIIIFAGFSVLLAGLLFIAANPLVAQEISPIHPQFPLLDADGANVLTSGNPVSTMQTCGACHDTAFITSHSGHADAGLSRMSTSGEAGRHTWDNGNGYFGGWNPITYRYLSPSEDERIDATLAEWIQIYGVRHPGGGPAVTSRTGEPLSALSTNASTVDTSIVDPATGELRNWDWAQSGTAELDCFMCHTSVPNNAARIDALQSGQFSWANTATLQGTGIVDQVDGAWTWNQAAFDPHGNLLKDFVTIQDPSNENCGQCHGIVESDPQTPVTLDHLGVSQWNTLTTGQVFSPQQLADSGLNLEGKETLTRSWDVHAERLVECVDCHYSLNNPVYTQRDADDQPEYLTNDPRRLDIGQYLYQPLHQLARSDAEGEGATNENAETCESCHDLSTTHEWLPYREHHMEVLECETCHASTLYAPALQLVDWTVMQTNGSPHRTYRGTANANEATADSLIIGFQPILLPQMRENGTTTIAPYNLITSWYWVYGDPARPVPLRDLQGAWLEGDHYPAEILAAFDNNGSGDLDNTELVIDSDAKESLIASRLEARGLATPHIEGETQPYAIHHDIAADEWAIRDCQTCHGENSRIGQSMTLSDRFHGGIQPIVFGSAGSSAVVVNSDSGTLSLQPQSETANLYILGHDNVTMVDVGGALLFLGVIFGASLHGGLRYLSARRRIPTDIERRRVYMYSIYERQWHWLQTLVILILIFTGLIIHKPTIFSAFSFGGVVIVHNIMAAILVGNAFLAAFYHLVSGEIRQFLPTPHGFFNDAIVRTKYYLRGIFNGQGHPFEKRPERKLNPLQQITYLAILNILLPLQVLTGAMMWGVQQWPDIAARLGGLPFLAPLHTLVAWLFASFIVLHVYLTTTGHKPLSDIQSMISGWDEVEVHPSPEKEEVPL
jgi:thiosulfate reductase cytochrome b subunit